MGYRVCQAASECAPFAKTGGLGDVVAGLSRALTADGHDVRVFLPFYQRVAKLDFPFVVVGKYLALIPCPLSSAVKASISGFRPWSTTITRPGQTVPARTDSKVLRSSARPSVGITSVMSGSVRAGTLIQPPATDRRAARAARPGSRRRMARARMSRGVGCRYSLPGAEVPC